VTSSRELTNAPLIVRNVDSATEVGRDCSERLETSMRNMAFVIVIGILIGTAGFVAKADQTAVAPPQGSTPLLEVRAEGVQSLHL
jgi:hypothetical protein